MRTFITALALFASIALLVAAAWLGALLFRHPLAGLFSAIAVAYLCWGIALPRLERYYRDRDWKRE